MKIGGMKLSKMKKGLVIKVLREHMEDIRRFGVKRIGIFGSVVRGEAGENSDIYGLAGFNKEVAL